MSMSGRAGGISSTLATVQPGAAIRTLMNSRRATRKEEDQREARASRGGAEQCLGADGAWAGRAGGRGRPRLCFPRPAGRVVGGRQGRSSRSSRSGSSSSLPNASLPSWASDTRPPQGGGQEVPYSHDAVPQPRPPSAARPASSRPAASDHVPGGAGTQQAPFFLRPNTTGSRAARALRPKSARYASGRGGKERGAGAGGWDGDAVGGGGWTSKGSSLSAVFRRRGRETGREGKPSRLRGGGGREEQQAWVQAVHDGGADGREGGGQEADFLSDAADASEVAFEEKMADTSEGKGEVFLPEHQHTQPGKGGGGRGGGIRGSHVDPKQIPVGERNLVLGFLASERCKLFSQAEAVYASPHDLATLFHYGLTAGGTVLLLRELDSEGLKFSSFPDLVGYVVSHNQEPRDVSRKSLATLRSHLGHGTNSRLAGSNDNNHDDNTHPPYSASRLTGGPTGGGKPASTSGKNNSHSIASRGGGGLGSDALQALHRLLRPLSDEDGSDGFGPSSPPPTSANGGGAFSPSPSFSSKRHHGSNKLPMSAFSSSLRRNGSRSGSGTTEGRAFSKRKLQRRKVLIDYLCGSKCVLLDLMYQRERERRDRLMTKERAARGGRGQELKEEVAKEAEEARRFARKVVLRMEERGLATRDIMRHLKSFSAVHMQFASIEKLLFALQSVHAVVDADSDDSQDSQEELDMQARQAANHDEQGEERQAGEKQSETPSGVTAGAASPTVPPSFSAVLLNAKAKAEADAGVSGGKEAGGPATPTSQRLRKEADELRKRLQELQTKLAEREEGKGQDEAGAVAAAARTTGKNKVGSVGKERGRAGEVRDEEGRGVGWQEEEDEDDGEEDEEDGGEREGETSAERLVRLDKAVKARRDRHAARQSIVAYLSGLPSSKEGGEEEQISNLLTKEIQVTGAELDALLEEGQGAEHCLGYLKDLNRAGRRFRGMKALTAAVRRYHEAAVHRRLLDLEKRLKQAQEQAQSVSQGATGRLAADTSNKASSGGSSSGGGGGSGRDESRPKSETTISGLSQKEILKRFQESKGGGAKQKSLLGFSSRPKSLIGSRIGSRRGSFGTLVAHQPPATTADDSTSSRSASGGGGSGGTPSNAAKHISFAAGTLVNDERLSEGSTSPAKTAGVSSSSQKPAPTTTSKEEGLSRRGSGLAGMPGSVRQSRRGSLGILVPMNLPSSPGKEAEELKAGKQARAMRRRNSTLLMQEDTSKPEGVQQVVRYLLSPGCVLEHLVINLEPQSPSSVPLSLTTRAFERCEKSWPIMLGHLAAIHACGRTFASFAALCDAIDAVVFAQTESGCVSHETYASSSDRPELQKFIASKLDDLQLPFKLLPKGLDKVNAAAGGLESAKKYLKLLEKRRAVKSDGITSTNNLCIWIRRQRLTEYSKAGRGVTSVRRGRPFFRRALQELVESRDMTHLFQDAIGRSVVIRPSESAMEALLGSVEPLGYGTLVTILDGFVSVDRKCAGGLPELGLCVADAAEYGLYSTKAMRDKAKTWMLGEDADCFSDKEMLKLEMESDFDEHKSSHLLAAGGGNGKHMPHFSDFALDGLLGHTGSVNDFISVLMELGEEGRRFASLKDMMVAVYAAKGRNPPPPDDDAFGPRHAGSPRSSKPHSMEAALDSSAEGKAKNKEGSDKKKKKKKKKKIEGEAGKDDKDGSGGKGSSPRGSLKQPAAKSSVKAADAPSSGGEGKSGIGEKKKSGGEEDSKNKREVEKGVGETAAATEPVAKVGPTLRKKIKALLEEGGDFSSLLADAEKAANLDKRGPVTRLVQAGGGTYASCKKHLKKLHGLGKQYGSLAKLEKEVRKRRSKAAEGSKQTKSGEKGASPPSSPKSSDKKKKKKKKEGDKEEIKKGSDKKKKSNKSSHKPKSSEGGEASDGEEQKKSKGSDKKKKPNKASEGSKESKRLASPKASSSKKKAAAEEENALVADGGGVVDKKAVRKSSDKKKKSGKSSPKSPPNSQEQEKSPKSSKKKDKSASIKKNKDEPKSPKSPKSSSKKAPRPNSLKIPNPARSPPGSPIASPARAKVTKSEVKKVTAFLQAAPGDSLLEGDEAKATLDDKACAKLVSYGGGASLCVKILKALAKKGKSYPSMSKLTHAVKPVALKELAKHAAKAQGGAGQASPGGKEVVLPASPAPLAAAASSPKKFSNKKSPPGSPVASPARAKVTKSEVKKVTAFLQAAPGDSLLEGDEAKATLDDKACAKLVSYGGGASLLVKILKALAKKGKSYPSMSKLTHAVKPVALKELAKLAAKGGGGGNVVDGVSPKARSPKSSAKQSGSPKKSPSKAKTKTLTVKEKLLRNLMDGGKVTCYPAGGNSLSIEDFRAMVGSDGELSCGANLLRLSKKKKVFTRFSELQTAMDKCKALSRDDLDFKETKILTKANLL